MNTPEIDVTVGELPSDFVDERSEIDFVETSGTFPFSEVVGLEDAKLALLLTTIEPAIGGVLLRGEKGSGKTTLARGLADLLGAATPFVNLPLGSGEDRLIGTLDLGAALTDNNIQFSPGLFAQAHGGVLYVDEVNLLADHLVDTLLDVAVSGINRVEREGISHAHLAEFVLVGSMNPEEGELRPQLLDRFGLCVDVAASREIDERVEAVTRRLRFSSAPTEMISTAGDDDLRQRLVHAAPASLDADVIKLCCELAIHFDVEGLRTDLVLAHAAAAFAGFEGRAATAVSDVQRVASLVLAHRGRKTMFDSAYRPADQIDQIVDNLLGDLDSEQPEEALTGEFPLVEDAPQPAGQGANHSPERYERDQEDDFYPETSEHSTETYDDSGGWSDDDVADSYDSSLDTDEIDLNATETEIEDPSEREGLAPERAMRAPSMLDETMAETPPLPPSNYRRDSKTNLAGTAVQGRNIGDLPFDPTTTNPIAVAATVRNLATRRSVDPEAKLSTSDLRQTMRENTKTKLLIFAVDTSGSMGAESRTDAAIGAIRSLLTNAYQNRSQIALVTFKGEEANVILSPTSSVEVANLRLGNISTGGTTPLGAGIEKAFSLAQDRRYADRERSIILLTDGRATGSEDAMTQAQAAAEAVKVSGIPAVVLDCENTFPRLGLAKELATTMNASYVELDDVTSDSVTSAVTSARQTEKVL